MKIYAVIVCYNPNGPHVARICECLVSSGCDVILVDNSDRPTINNSAMAHHCTVINLGTNFGIGYAQNRGVECALSLGADVVVFFDQDSDIDRGFVSALVAPLNLREAQVVAPVSIDRETGAELPSVRINRFGIPSVVYSAARSSPTFVDIVFSSGTAVTKEVFGVVGLLDEEFFIDFVDTEWCLRCRSAGVPVKVVPSAKMKHTIGTASIDLYITTILVHSSTRCYYQLRNCLHLFRKDHVPILFAIKETISVVFSRTLLLLFVSNRSDYLKAYLGAMSDGLKGVVGKKPRR